jgi:hypothetical protein
MPDIIKLMHAQTKRQHPLSATPGCTALTTLTKQFEPDLSRLQATGSTACWTRQQRWIRRYAGSSLQAPIQCSCSSKE